MKIYITTLLLLIFMSNIFAQNVKIDTMLKVKKQNFSIKIKSPTKDSGLITISQNHKSVLSEKLDVEGIDNIEFLDFNHDGYSDFVITYFSNNESNLLYLFDLKSKTFKKIPDFFVPLSSTQLKSNKLYYYSYERAGCADYNWKSQLFQIVNFKVIYFAQIDGIGCEFEIDKNLQAINVFDKKSRLVETLSYQKNINKLVDKWTFTENYWNKNYVRFK